MERAGDEILWGVQGRIGRMTLNRPRVLNALSLAMCRSLRARLDDWRGRADVDLVVIDAVPGRAFCAGGDVRAVCAWGEAGDPRALEFFAAEYGLNAAIKHYPKPFMALIDGIVMGGGAGISVHGRYRVVTENAVFAMPETAIGFFPDVGATYFLSRCPGAIGMYLGLTGARLRAADILYAGLATHFVPAVRIGEIVPGLVAGEPVETLLARLQDDPGPAPLEGRRDAIDRVFSAPSVTAILDMLGREGQWGREIADGIARCSPTSLKATHRALREAKGIDFDSCIRREYRLAAWFLEGHDFHEGVRSVLVHKHRQPVWRPSRLDDVACADIAGAFADQGPLLRF